ncbi:hypothetical protein V6N13_048284 [Hibiscus sabdariffa]
MNTIGEADDPVECGGEEGVFEGVFEGCGVDDPIEVGIGGGLPGSFLFYDGSIGLIPLSFQYFSLGMVGMTPLYSSG